MTDSLTCAVCGEYVPLDERHVHVTVETKDPRDRDGRDDYYLHARCAEAVTSGWREP